MRHALIRTFTSLALVGVCLLHPVGLVRLPGVATLDTQLSDAQIRWMASGVPDDRIAIVDIDEKSVRDRALGGEGRWPWPRDRLALLIERLFKDQGAQLVALDLLLSESDTSSGLEVLEDLSAGALKSDSAFQDALKRLRPQLRRDDLLARSMTSGPVVLGMAFHNDTTTAPTPMPAGVDPARWGGTQLRAQSFPNGTPPLPLLQSAAAAVGHLNPLRDPDGVTRRVPLLVEHQGRFHPALSVAALQVLTGGADLEVDWADYGPQDRRVESLRIGPLDVPVDHALNAVVPYRGPARTYTYVSAVDVIQGQVPAQVLKNRIVLVGTSAAGLSDLVTTPAGVSFPGVEVHANLISAMLDGAVLKTPAYVQGLQALGVVLAGLLMWAAGQWLRPAHQVLALLALISGVVAAQFSLAQAWQVIAPMGSVLVSLVLVFVFQVTFGYLVEARGFRQMTRLFATYVPPELVEKMAREPEAYTMAAAERALSVLFADVRNFTSTSEKLTPTALAEWINVYLSAMSAVIREQHQGTLDKYIGDAVMAFWGAPVTNAQHAEHAVRAAMAMQDAAHRLSQDFLARGWPPLAIGVGVNTGSMVVGDMGSNVRKAYTVMGDSVNLASRLEGLTKVYGVGVLVGEATFNALSGWVCREIDRVKVKGKDQAIAIYEPLGLARALDAAVQEELQEWNEALRSYRNQRWDKARAALKTLQLKHPDRKLYALYLERIEALQGQTLGPQWDGSTQFETK